MEIISIIIFIVIVTVMLIPLFRIFDLGEIGIGNLLKKLYYAIPRINIVREEK